jgi:2-dehydropantoate 2-reductase
VVQQLCDLFPDTFPLLVFQKGLGGIEQVEALRRKDTIIAGSVGFIAETVAQGTVTVTAVNEKTRIGGLKTGIPLTAVKQAADLLSGAGIPTLPAADIEKVLWNNALFGCALDGLATVLGVDYGFLGEQEGARHLVSSIVGEFFAVSEKEARKTDWPNPETYLRELFEVMIPARSTQFPLVLRQIQEGKRTEIDALNGAVVEMALSHGIDVPINWLIWQLVNAKQKMGSGKREA